MLACAVAIVNPVFVPRRACTTYPALDGLFCARENVAVDRESE